MKHILSAIKDKIEDLTVLDKAVSEIVACVVEATQCADSRRGVEMGLHCEIRPELIASLRRFVHDPDDEVESWLVDGSPLGIGGEA